MAKWCKFRRVDSDTIVCDRCGRKAKLKTTNVGRLCRTSEELVLAALPADDRKLAGDYLADLIALFGLPPCAACKKRQKWLNDVHTYLWPQS